MTLRYLIALFAIIAFTAPASARHYHHAHHYRVSIKSKAIEKQSGEFIQFGGLVERARQYNGLTASQIGLHRHSQWCAAFLRFLGVKGPVDDRAISFIHLTHVAPQPGVIAVWPHHVGIVTGFDGHYPIIISGNSYGRRVYEGTYRRTPIAYVSPSSAPAVYSQN